MSDYGLFLRFHLLHMLEQIETFSLYLSSMTSLQEEAMIHPADEAMMAWMDDTKLRKKSCLIVTSAACHVVVAVKYFNSCYTLKGFNLLDNRGREDTNLAHNFQMSKQLYILCADWRLEETNVPEVCPCSYRVDTTAASPSLHPIRCFRVFLDITKRPGKKMEPAATAASMAPDCVCV